MQRVTTGILIIACAMGGFAAAKADSVNLPSNEDLTAAGWFEYWSMDLRLSTGDPAGAIYPVDDSLYVLTEGGEAYSVHTGAGLLRWARRICDRKASLFMPSHFDSPDYESTFLLDGNDDTPHGPKNKEFNIEAGTPLVLLPSFSGITIVERFSGRVIKFLPKMHALGGSPIAKGKTIFLGSADGHMYAEDWTIISRGKPYTRWQVKTDGPITTTPWLVDPSRLVFATGLGRIYCCTQAERKLIWEYKIQDTVTGRPAVGPNSVFVASMDRSLYCLDRETGKQKWRRRLPEKLSDGPVLMNNIVYQYCSGYGIYAIGAEDSAILWQYEPGLSFVCRQGDHVCFRTHEGLAVLEESTGKELARIPLGADINVAMNYQDATLYMVSTNGRVLCAKPKGTPRLTVADIQKANQTLHRQVDEKSDAEQQEDDEDDLSSDHGIDYNDPLRSRN